MRAGRRLTVILFLTESCLVAPGSDGGRDLRLVIEPEAGRAPILEAMGAAQRSLWIEAYLLTDEDTLDAIEGRAAAGVDVRVILEPAPYLDEGANLPAYERLARAGVRVRWASDRFRFTHAKTLLVDHARLIVMSLNLTTAGLGGGNREYAVIDDDPRDVAAAERVFAGDELGAVTPGDARLVTSPDLSRGVLSGLIGEATASLEIESEELNDLEIQAALTAARARGVAVTVVLPAAGAAPVIHAKATVADRRACYVGSANFSATSLDRNREVGLRLDDPTICGAIAQTIAGDAARRAVY